MLGLAGGQFSLQQPFLQHIGTSDEGERARLFQRSVIYESLVPMLTKGLAGSDVVLEMCETLMAHFAAEVPKGQSDYMQAVIKEVEKIAGTILVIAGRSRSEQHLRAAKSVLESKSGVTLLASQAMTQNNHWQRLVTQHLRYEAAAREFGPGLAQFEEQLAVETPEVETLEACVKMLPQWRDALPSGQ